MVACVLNIGGMIIGGAHHTVHPEGAIGVGAHKQVVQIKEIVGLKSKGLGTVVAVLFKGSGIDAEAHTLISVKPLAHAGHQTEAPIVTPR